DIDAQCAAGLGCVCAAGSGWPPAFVHGFCSAPCDTGAWGAGAVCAALGVLRPVDAGAGASVCVAACQKSLTAPASGDCGPGSVCQTLPASPAAAGTAWTTGCLPLGALQDMGDPCRDANEALADQACTTGLCADVGALGVCSAGCDDSHPCPNEAACVLLAGGRQLCLRTCTA